MNMLLSSDYSPLNYSQLPLLHIAMSSLVFGPKWVCFSQSWSGRGHVSKCLNGVGLGQGGWAHCLLRHQQGHGRPRLLAAGAAVKGGTLEVLRYEGFSWTIVGDGLNSKRC